MFLMCVLVRLTDAVQASHSRPRPWASHDSHETQETRAPAQVPIRKNKCQAICFNTIRIDA
jgi:hypothetical protein